LGLDFVPVITGFSHQFSRSVPEYDGIIILDSQAPLVIEAYTNWAQSQVDKANQEREKRIARRWEHMVRHLLMQAQINERYGAGPL
jgi:predicted YcjX-like family ATPase